MTPLELRSWLMKEAALNLCGPGATQPDKMKALALATAAQSLGEPRGWKIETVDPFRIFLFDELAESDSSMLGVLKHANFPVQILLDCAGGAVPTAMALARRLGELDSTVIVTGQCLSAANFVLQGCKTRQAVRAAKFMFHKVTATVRGNPADLRSAADYLEKDIHQTLEFFCQRTGVSRETAWDWHTGNEITFNAKEALKLNLIDGIVDEMDLPEREIPHWPGMKSTLDQTLGLELGRALTGLEIPVADRAPLATLLDSWLHPPALVG